MIEQKETGKRVRRIGAAYGKISVAMQWENESTKCRIGQGERQVMEGYISNHIQEK